MNFLSPSTTQQGSALIVTLSILLILTLLGISAMSTSTLQERMAGNARDAEVAFESAETAIRAAEKYIESIATTSVFNNSAGKYAARGSSAEAWKTEGNWSGAVNYSISSTVAKSPHYMIQIIESTLGESDEVNSGAAYGSGGNSTDKPTVFQITARGYGLSPNSRVMLQSYYGRYF